MKENLKKMPKGGLGQLTIPVIAVALLVVFNLIRDPGFFSISITHNNYGNAVLAGNLISIINGASELAILAIGFIAMLVAEADARRRELAVLRAVGATRAQLAARLAASALKTALVGIVVGLPVGAVVGWRFAIGTASIWKGMPHYFVVPWCVVAEGAFFAVLFALAFALPTSLSLVRSRRA